MDSIPRGTRFHDVISRGDASVSTVPSSEAQVSPFANEIVPNMKTNFNIIEMVK